MSAGKRPPRREIQEGQDRIPDRLYMEAPLTDYQAHIIAVRAVALARSEMPKFSGRGARQLQPLWGEGFFGMRWDDDFVWFQEIGIRPFTMRSLAGKTIPMWIKDPTGRVRQQNPKAETQIGEDGVVRVLIFRRAALLGQRKTVMRKGVPVSVPASYPGAPGRIALREAAAPLTRQGRLGGQIARGNVGVRWRHPGLVGRNFMHRAMVRAAVEVGLDPTAPVWATTQRWGR
jgi:hypothetical protein